jgi:hypothetical protein
MSTCHYETYMTGVSSGGAYNRLGDYCNSRNLARASAAYISPLAPKDCRPMPPPATPDALTHGGRVSGVGYFTVQNAYVCRDGCLSVNGGVGSSGPSGA